MSENKIGEKHREVAESFFYHGAPSGSIDAMAQTLADAFPSTSEQEACGLLDRAKNALYGCTSHLMNKTLPRGIPVTSAWIAYGPYHQASESIDEIKAYLAKQGEKKLVFEDAELPKHLEQQWEGVRSKELREREGGKKNLIESSDNSDVEAWLTAEIESGKAYVKEISDKRDELGEASIRMHVGAQARVNALSEVKQRMINVSSSPTKPDEVCPECEGWKQIIDDNYGVDTPIKCPTCHGTGKKAS